MSDPDFYTRIAPWTRTIAPAAPIALAAAGVSAVVGAVAAGFSRWVLGFSVAEDDNLLGQPIILRTAVGAVPVAAAGYRFAGLTPVLNRLLTNSADTALEIINVGVGATTLVYTVVIADTPPNVLSNLAIGAVAG